MTLGSRKGSSQPPVARLSLWARVALIPLRERCFLLLVLTGAAVPAVFALPTIPFGGRGSSRSWDSYPEALAIGAAIAAVIGGLLLVEAPRSLSLRGYAAQLGARFARAQAQYDAAFRRRTQEEERNEEDHPVEPQVRTGP